MDRIGGPQHVREGLLSALSEGVGVTAKISWLTHSKRRSLDATSNMSPDSTSDVEALEGKPRWIHCTPLLGSDSKPGVIMVVMVDKEEITGSLNRAREGLSNFIDRNKEQMVDGWPLRGMGVANREFTSQKLYAEYLRREGAITESVNGGRSIRSEDGAKSTTSRKSRSTSMRKIGEREAERERES